MTQNNIEEIICELSAILFEIEDGQITRITPSTDWFTELVSEQKTFTLSDVFEYMPFLHHFLEDANQHWENGNTSKINSGPWIEHLNQEELALEAYALNQDGKHYILLKNLADSYLSLKDAYQKARNSLLESERLEQALLQQIPKLNS